MLPIPPAISRPHNNTPVSCKVQSSETPPERLHHMVAASAPLNAMLAGGAVDYAMTLSVCLQALFNLLLASLSLVFIAALVAVPLYIALPAPLVLTYIAL